MARRPALSYLQPFMRRCRGSINSSARLFAGMILLLGLFGPGLFYPGPFNTGVVFGAETGNNTSSNTSSKTVKNSAKDAALHQALGKLIRHGGVIVGEGSGINSGGLANSSSGISNNSKVLFQHKPGQYTPASIIKLATALAFFHTLGEDYRFRTEIYLADGNLYIKGYGDPFLVSEEWALLADELARTGILKNPLGDIVIDESAIASNLEVDGRGDSLNPYDAPLGAVFTNFNTLFVAVSPLGTVTSAEPQTPLIPLARKLSRGLPPGRHRINLAAKGVAGAVYAGELARAFFTRQGGSFTGRIRQGRTPENAKLLITHRSSRDGRELVRSMLEFSNNIIANALVLAISEQHIRLANSSGALKDSRPPAGLARGVRGIKDILIEKLGLSADDFTLIEGSGLSRNTRISLAAMLKIVDAFHPWRQLLKPYGKPPNTIPAKTGTLTGVYSLAGFLPAPQGTRRPFVIILNQRRHVRGKVYRLLQQRFGDHPAKLP